MLPLIGIPPGLDERGRWKCDRIYQYVDVAYASAVAQAGGLPVYLPREADVAALTARLDGLLIPGGDDFAPETAYPETVRFDPAPAEQIAFDRRVLAAALERRIPVLGICYGMQLLALHHGGSLHYDIPSDVPDATEHRLPEPDGRHALRIVPRTRLADALGAAEPFVNSRHHQAVSRVEQGLAVSARAGDGIIEALEHESQPFCIGVQWHPESMQGPHRERLFRAFVAACAGV
jgi:putative glutamine amidotransferase